MANFDFPNIYYASHFTKIYDDKPIDVEDRFFSMVKQQVSATKMNDLDVKIEDFTIPQGIFSFGAKKVKLCEVSFKDSNLNCCYFMPCKLLTINILPLLILAKGLKNKGHFRVYFSLSII